MHNLHMCANVRQKIQGNFSACVFAPQHAAIDFLYAATRLAPFVIRKHVNCVGVCMHACMSLYKVCACVFACIKLSLPTFVGSESTRVSSSVPKSAIIKILDNRIHPVWSQDKYASSPIHYDIDTYPTTLCYIGSVWCLIQQASSHNSISQLPWQNEHECASVACQKTTWRDKMWST